MFMYIHVYIHIFDREERKEGEGGVKGGERLIDLRSNDDSGSGPRILFHLLYVLTALAKERKIKQEVL